MRYVVIPRGVSSFHVSRWAFGDASTMHVCKARHSSFLRRGCQRASSRRGEGVKICVWIGHGVML